MAKIFRFFSLILPTTEFWCSSPVLPSKCSGKTCIQKRRNSILMFHFPRWIMGDTNNCKIIVNPDISNLCNQILKLNEKISQLHSAKEKINWQLWKMTNLNWKSGSSIWKKVKPSSGSTGVTIISSCLVFRVIYKKIIWRKSW